MTSKDLDETLATIASKAKVLREAGVVGRVTVGDVSFELAKPEPPPPVQVTQLAAEELHPLDDHETYGTAQVPTPPWERKSPKPQQSDEDEQE